MNRPKTIREFERHLREVCGLSWSEAKIVASRGFGALRTAGAEPEAPPAPELMRLDGRPEPNIAALLRD
ncbi:MAG: hypothetical protein J0H09_08195 [Burkholderiales bacterium]|mgnify:CR=1 FL=1|nr:hypothetical protein [Burkholderiales bacterium]